MPSRGSLPSCPALVPHAAAAHALPLAGHPRPAALAAGGCPAESRARGLRGRAWRGMAGVGLGTCRGHGLLAERLGLGARQRPPAQLACPENVPRSPCWFSQWISRRPSVQFVAVYFWARNGALRPDQRYFWASRGLLGPRPVGSGVRRGLPAGVRVGEVGRALRKCSSKAQDSGNSLSSRSCSGRRPGERTPPRRI